MKMNARFVGALLLVVTGIGMAGYALGTLPADPPVRSVATGPAATFGAPVAEGGRLFTALLDAPRVSVRSPEATLVIDEIITPVLAGRILAMSDASLAYVELDSIGGDVQAAILIAERLRQAGSHTHVGAGARCFSACPVIYQGGVVRSADPGALFLLHYAVQFSDDPGRAHMGSIWGTVALIEAMIELGVDPGIYDQMPGFGDWLLTASQAVELDLVQHVGSRTKAALVPPFVEGRQWQS
ncbi:MAG: hypothetical protein COA62_09610 [Rhodobiaceae bacterium]|nr:MAG: hypothetical protein COA62_09610 [Rhodobiaceae bacterium]